MCKFVDPIIAEEEDKVAHLTNGIAEDVFNFLSVKEVDSIADVLRSSRHFEAL